MKQLLAISLLVLIGACTNYEDQVKDLRNHDMEFDEESVPEDINSDEEETTIEEKPDEKIDAPATSEWSYKVTFLSENNWGYQIFQKDKMIINQTSIPSVPGVNGFDTEEKAERTAKHILSKVENGIFPPTVDKKELENLGVLRD